MRLGVGVAALGSTALGALSLVGNTNAPLAFGHGPSPVVTVPLPGTGPGEVIAAEAGSDHGSRPAAQRAQGSSGLDALAGNGSAAAGGTSSRAPRGGGGSGGSGGPGAPSGSPGPSGPDGQGNGNAKGQGNGNAKGHAKGHGGKSTGHGA